MASRMFCGVTIAGRSRLAWPGGRRLAGNGTTQRRHEQLAYRRDRRLQRRRVKATSCGATTTARSPTGWPGRRRLRRQRRATRRQIPATGRWRHRRLQRRWARPTSCGAMTTARSPTGSDKPTAASPATAATSTSNPDQLAHRRHRRLQRRRRDRHPVARRRWHGHRLARPINGGFAATRSQHQQQSSSNWHIVGTGDFNGDGMTDILWRDRRRHRHRLAWSVRRRLRRQRRPLQHSTVSRDWHIVSTGDYNGDGTSDILWQQQQRHRDAVARPTDGTITGNSANVTSNLPRLAYPGSVHSPGLNPILAGARMSVLVPRAPQRSA